MNERFRTFHEIKDRKELQGNKEKKKIFKKYIGKKRH